MKPVRTWILLADGAQARVYENLGPGKGLQHVSGYDLSQERLQSQDIVTDRPGRSFSSSGPGRSAMEPPTDPAEKREDDFTRKLADILASAEQKKTFDRLIIIAAPTALGSLRAHLNSHVRTKVIAELPKDLTGVPEKDLGKHLDGVLAL